MNEPNNNSSNIIIYQTEDGNFCAGLPLCDFGCITSNDRLTRTGTRSVLSAIQFSCFFFKLRMFLWEERMRWMYAQCCFARKNYAVNLPEVKRQFMIAA